MHKPGHNTPLSNLELNQRVFDTRDSEAGKKAVSKYKKKVFQDKVASRVYKTRYLNEELDKVGTENYERKKSVRGPDYPAQFDDSLKRQHPGYSGHKDREGFPRDLYVDDVNEYVHNIEGAGAFVTPEDLPWSTGTEKNPWGNQIVMPTPPNPLQDDYPGKKLAWDSTYWHERSHQSRGKYNESGDEVFQGMSEGHDWHDRPEEQMADYGRKEVLQENLERAGIEYSPQTGRDFLRGETAKHGTPIIKNPSSLMFRNRLEFLPQTQPDRSRLFPSYDSVLDVGRSNMKQTTDYNEFLGGINRLNFNLTAMGEKPGWGQEYHNRLQSQHNIAFKPFDAWAATKHIGDNPL